ncbi:MAG: hypothetical protein ACKVJH_00485 [Flavobacteriales bacterium]|jgi:tetratricopeptide (TPR) repeat protein
MSVKSFLLMCFVVCSTAVFGQQSPVDRAVALGQRGDWAQALIILEPEVKKMPWQADSHAWYVLGYVQKELHKASGSGELNAPERLGAVYSLDRALSMGPNREDDALIRAALDFLARSFFRDAIDRIEGFTEGSDEEALALFGRYEAIGLNLDPMADVTGQKADLYRYLGQANGLLLDRQEGRDLALETILFERSVAHYSAALELVPKDYPGRYNLAITLYNQGVRQLKRINHETSMFELMEIQETCVGLFEQALPVMEAAHLLKPNRLETLKGLMTIHYALSQQEESSRYRDAIDRLIEKRP